MTRHAEVVADLLRTRYAPPAWAFLEQVRNRTGYGGQERYADGIAMSLWPSRGLEVHGFEIKVSRQDLLSELADVKKSMPLQKYCDRWWLAVGDKSIIQPGELPPTWGLLVVEGDKKPRLRAVTEAPKLSPEPLSPVFVASLLRNFEQNYVPVRVHNELKRDMDARVKDGINERLDAERDRYRQSLEAQQQRTRQLEELIDEFEKKTGERLSHWNLGALVDATRIVRSAGFDRLRSQLQQTAACAERLLLEAKGGLRQLDVQQAGSVMLPNNEAA